MSARTDATVPGPFRVRVAPARRDADVLKGLLREGFADFTEETAELKVRSQYVENPAGEAECLVLEAPAGETAGMQCLVRRQFARGAQRFDAAIFADFVVLPAFRSLGPALLLVRESTALARRAFAFAYGFPNEKAKPVFTHTGLKPTLRVVRYAHPLRATRALSALLPPSLHPLLPLLAPVATGWIAIVDLVRSLRLRHALRWEFVEDFDDAFDELWAGAQRDGLILAERTHEALRWRFRNRSDHRISVARGADGRLEGYVVWTTRRRAVVVLDLLCRRPDDILAPFLAGFARHVRGTGEDAVSAELLLPARFTAAITAAGFREREASDMVLIVGDSTPIPELTRDLYITHFDRDSL